MPAPVLAPLVGAAAGAAAYRAVQGAAEGLAQGGFGAVLQRAVEGVLEVQRSADAAATRALQGQGSVTEVVLAVSRAELALQTATTLRDRIVAAYQDVMRMPI
ncbi:MAG: flagellar hook-basal body complex protein FliE [Rhodovarius sp.]|nr:flagellar hook-basal body complex protein FliE [Rhodovarius sp.]MCX7933060.1 flagellar hook-basal body complex protein FliE [Rhodovarius sp.]MDW8314224.1 flagellar hook-basal body complex protein FliE [Rhodovarius sp.]